MSENTALPSVLTDAREHLLPSLRRHVVPALVGWLLSVALVREFGATFGVTQAMWVQAATTVVTAVWYLLWRLVEVYAWPRLSGLASVVLGLGVGAPAYQPKHRAVTRDAGSARLGVPVLLAVAAIVVVTMVAVTASDAEARRPRVLPLPVVTSATVCGPTGLLTVRYADVAMVGGQIQEVPDSWGAAIQLHYIGNGAPEGGQWGDPLPTVRATEGMVAADVAGRPTWDTARVVAPIGRAMVPSASRTTDDRCDG